MTIRPISTTLIALLACCALQAFAAEPDKVVGWRGDGTGHYPDATPPTTWSRNEKGEKKNILWETKLPCYTWSTPIIVGDKVFTRSEPYDLICLNKLTGKLLWIRSHPAYITVTAEEKKANPAFAEIEPLIAELQKLNDAFVEKGWSKELYKQKHDLQKRINDLTFKADRKYALPPDMYVESWCGYTGATPCSDGKDVFISSGNGITASYDLAGKLKWARYESIAGGWGEHGQSPSPVIADDKLIAVTTNLAAFDKATGKEIWRAAAFCGNPYALVKVNVGGTDFVISAGNYVRAKDGKIVVPRVGDMPGCMVVTNGDMVYYTQNRASFMQVLPKADNELTVKPLITEEYNRVNMPSGDSKALKVDPTISGFYTASPLYHNNLLYCVGNFGILTVVDTTKTKQADSIVYSMFPPFDFKNPYSRKSVGMGIGASPAMAGKYIYMIDSAGCMLVVEPGREFKLIAKNNIDEIVPEGWEEKHWMGPHHEQTEASPIFEGNRIYIRGEQNLYCVAEKP